MSHFSKIRTSLSDIKLLKMTLKDLGFSYQMKKKEEGYNRLYVSKFSNDDEMFVFFFDWDGKSYSLITDITLWNLDDNFENFLEKLHQQYAYNVVIDQSTINGFNTKSQDIMIDGSIKLTVQKWVNAYS